MSSTINNHDSTSYQLPRGYFSDKKHANKILLLLCTLLTLNLTILINGVAGDDRLRRTIEENSTPIPPALPSDGICKSIDVRFDLLKIQALAGCRVVEGSVAILLLDEITTKDVANITFPDLVEITGYLLLYRVSGFTSLDQLFPNLAVIRGKDLFENTALIIYEMLDLLEIGLKNLLTVERGNVRIKRNEQLCFTDTIQWKKIAMNGEPYIEKNKLPSHCPNCPSENCPKSIDGKTTYCWNVNHCQRLCSNCVANSSCSPNGTCCDKKCIGGCQDGYPSQCIACKKFSLGRYPNIKCVDLCPNGTYAYLERRCLSKEECYDLNTSNPSDSNVSNPDPEHSFIPFDSKCIRECPPRYIKHVIGKEMSCKLCNKTCQNPCVVKTIVDSIEAAQALKGCSTIDGPLEIQIRGTAKNPVSGKNIVKELEEALSDIIEINDYLKITRSHPILSMSFLKNLKTIHGKRLEGGRNALVVWENHNLQELWDESQKIEILNGKLFFQHNPKLCFFKIEQFANKSVTSNGNLSTIIENYGTAFISNGDKIQCNVTSLNVTVEHVYAQAALLSWDPLKFVDKRSLNYVVFYVAAPHQNVTLWDGRDACGNDGWSVEDVNDFSESEKISQPLTKLEPYTQYAYYVKAYTLDTNQNGSRSAQSEIKYFTTKPGMPDSVKKFKATPLGPDRIEVTWETLKKVNGRLKNYVLRAKIVDQNEKLRFQRDFCKEPLDTSGNPQTLLLKDANKETPKLPTLIALDGTCNCKACSSKCNKQTQHNIADHQSLIDFENQIQDLVFGFEFRDNEMESFPEDRAKRQVNDELPEKLAEPNPPHIDPDILRNSSDFFDDEIKPTQISYEIKGLKHYTMYAISIRACREKEVNETESPESQACGYEVNYYATTFREPSNDDIPGFTTEILPNESTADVLVKWDSPKDPNGFLLTYTIRYKRVDIDHTVSQTRCVSYNMLNNTNVFVIRALTAGNYSIDIMATSLGGNGNYTKAKYVLIEEPGAFSMWYIAGGLLFIFVVCLVIVFNRDRCDRDRKNRSKTITDRTIP